MAKQAKPKVAHASCDKTNLPLPNDQIFLAVAPLLKSAWQLKDIVGGYFTIYSALETSASGIVWSTEIGQWNDLTCQKYQGPRTSYGMESPLDLYYYI